MTHDDHHHTHTELAARLRESIATIRQDVEARSDSVLAELAHALETLVEITTHAHDHALENRGRIEAIEARLEGRT
jgi:hypothetical protein